MLLVFKTCSDKIEMNMDMLTSINIVLGIFVKLCLMFNALREMKFGVNSKDGLF